MESDTESVDEPVPGTATTTAATSAEKSLQT
jgi:hypothetical protein